MQPLRLSAVTATLSVGDLLLNAAIEAAFLAALPVACDRDVLKAQVDSDLLLSGDTLFDRYGHGQAQPPIPQCILRKATLSPLNALKTLRLEHPKGLAAEAHGVAFALDTRCLERHPAQGTAWASAHPPAQSDTFGGAALHGVFAGNSLDRVRTDLFEILRSPRGERAEVKPAQPFT